MAEKNLFREIPKMDILLENPELQSLMEKVGRSVVVDQARGCLDELREELKKNPTEETLREGCSNLIPKIIAKISHHKERNLKPVINATGVVLHTNLGRAPLPQEAIKRLASEMGGYMNLEYDLNAGKRGERYSHFEEMICRITGAEAAMAVNNNAAATMLMVSAVGRGKEVIVSRGEQVEIGGKFRIPDIIDQSGAKRVEVGTTNKTHISDYEDKITEDTAALLKVHHSNFKITGFTENVSREDLVELGRKYDVPVIEDLGSGILIDLSKYGYEKEPTVQDSLKAGVDVVSFSGDKLFGGPQAGILVGKKKYIDLCKKHPLTRAMRIDKCSAALLETVWSMYEDEAYAISHIPVLAMLLAPEETLQEKAEYFASKLEGLKKWNADFAIVETQNPAGGGSLPGEVFPGRAIAISSATISPDEMASRLRGANPPVVARIENDELYFEVRTLSYEEMDILSDILLKEYEK